MRKEEELETGLSNARNRWLTSARGKYIAWTDDDVIINPHWLGAYWKAIQSHPEAAVFFGKIVPMLEEPSAEWFRRNLHLLGDLVAARDFGPKELPLSLAEYRAPFGASFLVRAVEQLQFPYDVNLGAGAQTGALGEESSVIRSIVEAGGRGYWVPEAIVHHVISVNRQTLEYIKYYYHTQGVMRLYLPRDNTAGQRSLTNLETIKWIKVVLSFVLYRIAFWLNLESFWIKRLKGYAYWRGALDEGLRRKHHIQPIRCRRSGQHKGRSRRWGSR